MAYSPLGVGSQLQGLLFLAVHRVEAQLQETRMPPASHTVLPCVCPPHSLVLLGAFLHSGDGESSRGCREWQIESDM